MPKKQASEGGKKNEIIDAALQLFLENGYDGTTVRMIQRKVGSEVGLFYYYFKNKDDLFDAVLDRFFDRYIKDFNRMIKQGRRNPCRIMEDFFEYLGVETVAFRDKYAGNIHRTVQWAIREHTLTIIEPFLAEIVTIQSNYYGIEPALEPEVAALFLTHGVGSSILHKDRIKYEKMRTEIRHGVSLIMGMLPEEQELRIPFKATAGNIPACMELSELTKDAFPGYNSAVFLTELEKHINNNEAWVYSTDGKIAAIALYSLERCELDYLTVHPDYRRRGLAARLVETVAAQFPLGSNLSVITYLADDEKGKEAAGFYNKLGFCETEKVSAFGYPCRKMVLNVTEEIPQYKGISRSKLK